jgi:Na+/melibiose symporter-like transporter
MFIALTMATDITAQAQFVAVCASVMTGVSLTWLVSVTRERPAADSDQKPSTPFLATIYALQRNRPYRNCACLGYNRRLPHLALSKRKH